MAATPGDLGGSTVGQTVHEASSPNFAKMFLVDSASQARSISRNTKILQLRGSAGACTLHIGPVVHLGGPRYGVSWTCAVSGLNL
eukprot:9035964-Karenia_brevis.AAC.1